MTRPASSRRRLRRALAPAAALAALAAALVLPPRPAAPASPPAPRGSGGAVVSGDAYATEAGLEMLAAGGNAVDAAVATALVLAVTFPEAGNLGGGGFAVVRLEGGPEEGDEEVLSLDFRETAPAAAHRGMYLDADGSWPGGSPREPTAPTARRAGRRRRRAGRAR